MKFIPVYYYKAGISAGSLKKEDKYSVSSMVSKSERKKLKRKKKKTA